MNPLVDATPPRTAKGSELLQAGDARIRILAGAHTGAPFGVIDYHIPPGFAPPPVLHRHTREDSGWFILEGEIIFTYADGTEFRAGPGASTEHPEGCWFRWANAHSDRPARAICWYKPAGFEQLFVDVAAGVEEILAIGGDQAAIGAKLSEIRAKYGDQEHPGNQA